MKKSIFVELTDGRTAVSVSLEARIAAAKRMSAMESALLGAAGALSALAVSLPPNSEAAKYADDEARKLCSTLVQVQS